MSDKINPDFRTNFNIGDRVTSWGLVGTVAVHYNECLQVRWDNVPDHPFDTFLYDGREGWHHKTASLQQIIEVNSVNAHGPNYLLRTLL